VNPELTLTWETKVQRTKGRAWRQQTHDRAGDARPRRWKNPPFGVGGAGLRGRDLSAAAGRLGPSSSPEKNAPLAALPPEERARLEGEVR
jgi:hypothetical protein